MRATQQIHLQIYLHARTNIVDVIFRKPMLKIAVILMFFLLLFYCFACLAISNVNNVLREFRIRSCTPFVSMSRMVHSRFLFRNDLIKIHIAYSNVEHKVDAFTFAFVVCHVMPLQSMHVSCTYSFYTNALHSVGVVL